MKSLKNVLDYNRFFIVIGVFICVYYIVKTTIIL